MKNLRTLQKKTMFVNIVTPSHLKSVIAGVKEPVGLVGKGFQK